MYRHDRPFQRRSVIFLALLVVVFVAESVAMALLGLVFPEAGRANWRETLFDALSVVVLSAPFIWWLAMRPLERALQGEQGFGQTLFDNAGALIAVLDRDGRIVRFNAGCEHATGFSAAEVVGRDLFDLLIPEDLRAQVRKVFSECVEGEFPPQYQNEWLTRAGGRRWIAWTNHVLRDAAGRVEYVVANGLDMTAQREQEERLRESEARFRLLFDSAEDAILVNPAPMGIFIDANAAACQRLGYTREQLLRLGPADIDGPGDDSARERALDELAASGSARFERTLLARDGRAIPVEINARRFEIHGTAHIISIARDITAQKAGEQRIRESEARLRALIEAVGQSAMLMAMDGKVLAVNTVAAQRLGRRPEDIVGHDIYAMIPPAVADSRRRRINALAIDPHPITFEDERNGMRLRHLIVPIRDEAGRTVQVAIFAEDVTEATLLRRTDNLLHGFDQQVLGGRSFTDILCFACDQFAEDFGYEVAWAGRKMPDGTVQVLHAAGVARDYVREIHEAGVRWDATPTGNGPAGITIRGGEPQVFWTDDAGFAPWLPASERHGLQAILGLPLIAHGAVYGVMLLYSRDADAFTRGDTVSSLQHVGARLNVVVEASERQQQMQLLRLAIETAGSGILVTHADGTIEWSNSALRQMTGYSEAELVGRTPRLFNSGTQDADYYRHFWQSLASGETWRGETVNRRKDGSLITVMQVVAPVHGRDGEIAHFVSVMEDISQRKQAEAQIRHLAEHDPLTDLPNRTLMHKRLAQMLSGEKRRSQEQVGVLYLDIDRFKQINDGYGHDVGDALLRGFAERLRGVVRTEDTVARVGGDEFVVLLPGMQAPQDARIVAGKILAALERPIDCLGTALVVGSSIGIAHAPGHGSEPVALLKCADVAMYAAKQAGRNIYRVFDAAIAGASA
jgi:diguanylate cyclase (GGDEF)-like protein/PAS domain S-box-containing protein